MRATPFASIFEALRSLIESDAQRAQAIAASRGFGDKDPAIAELDKQYFAANPYQALVRANADWLRGLPELKVVPNFDHAQAIRALCDANPQRAARLHAHRREAMGRKLLDPLHVAARLLCTRRNACRFVELAMATRAPRLPMGGKVSAGKSRALRAGR